jgi:hypothetical protein
MKAQIGKVVEVAKQPAEVAKTVDQLIEALAAGPVTVRFTKVDGSTREGVFTTNRERIDASGWKPAPAKPGATPRAPTIGLLNVFEESAKSWKCFRVSAVLHWEKVG